MIISLVSLENWADLCGIELIIANTKLTAVPLFSAKNVAADIAVQLCESVANKLEGKVMGTFSSKYLHVIKCTCISGESQTSWVCAFWQTPSFLNRYNSL